MEGPIGLQQNRFSAMQAIDEPLAATEAATVGDSAPVQSVAKEAEPEVAVAAKVKKTKAPSSRAKKSVSRPRKPPTHPPYAEMIKEAISALKERTGSSPYAIAKCMEDKHKAHLPSNFRKILLLQLKKLAASGKLNKVKGSYKLSSGLVAAKAASKKPATSKSNVAAKLKPVPATAKPKPTVAKAKPAALSSKSKAKTVAKAKSISSSSVKLKPATAKSALKRKMPAKPKSRSAARPAKAAKTSAKDAPGKKTVKAPMKSTVVPRKSAIRKPKSVSAPARKAKK